MSSVDPPEDPNHIRRRLRSTTRADRAAAAGPASSTATPVLAPEPAPSLARKKSSGKARRKDPAPRATQPTVAAPPSEKASSSSSHVDGGSANPGKSSLRPATRLARKKSAAVNRTAQALVPSGAGSATALESTTVSLDTAPVSTIDDDGGNCEIAPPVIQPPLRRSTRARKGQLPAVPATGSLRSGDTIATNGRESSETVVQPPRAPGPRAREDIGHAQPTQPLPVQRGQPSSSKDLQRTALDRARTMRQVTPVPVPRSEPAPGFSTPKPKYTLPQAHSLNTQVHGTPHGHTTRTGTVDGDGVEVTKKQLAKELKPVSYCYPKHVTTLYRELANDKEIDAFLFGADSGFTVKEQSSEEGSDGESGSVEESEGSEVMSEQGGEEGCNNLESNAGSEEGSDVGSQGRDSQSGERVTVGEEDLKNESFSEEQATSKGGDTSDQLPPPYPGGCWDDMPQPAALECYIYPNLIKIIVKIQEHLSKPAPSGVTRTAVDCSAKDFKHINHQNTRPDVVIRATGPSFEVPKADSPEQHLGGKKSSQKSLQDIGYTNAAAVIEVKRDSSDDTDWDNVAQAGMYCREIWAQQANRLFVRALIVTETRVRLIHYDRAGVLATPFFNYHEDPRTFVRLILGLTSTDEDVLGFDTSIQWKIDPTTKRKKSGIIKTLDENKESIDYKMLSLTPDFVHHSIRGRGTTCWRVKHPKGGKTLMIKDAWCTGTRKSESVYLEAAKKLPGVAKMISCREDIADTDRFRPALYDGEFKYENRVKVRILMEAHGKTVEHYGSRYELVAAIKDAIKAHRGLHEILILHRDISAANILLGLDEDNLCGYLIDLHMAIFIDRDESEVSSDLVTGTRLYQPISVLKSYGLEIKTPHDYLDDLESFFYVLGHAMFTRLSPGKEMPSRVAETLEDWQSTKPGAARASKAEMMMGDIPPVFVDVDYWGDACTNLLEGFHAFLQRVAIQKKDKIRNTRGLGHHDQVLKLRELGFNIEDHYNKVDTLFQTALDLLKTEESEINARLAKLSVAAGPKRGEKKGKRDRDDAETSDRASKRRTGSKPLAAPATDDDSSMDLTN